MYPGFSAQPSNCPPGRQPTGGRAEADLPKTGGKQRKAAWVEGSGEPRRAGKATRSQEAGSSEEAGLGEAGRKAR